MIFNPFDKNCEKKIKSVTQNSWQKDLQPSKALIKVQNQETDMNLSEIVLWLVTIITYMLQYRHDSCIVNICKFDHPMFWKSPVLDWDW